MLALVVPVGHLQAASATAGPSISDIAQALSTAASSPAPNFQTTTPSITHNTKPYDLRNVQTCFLSGVFPTNPATSCLFGDPTGATTMFAFGDSQAAMWIPAFDVLGQTLGIRVIYAAHVGCGPSDAFGNSPSAACTTFQQAAIAYANTLKPTFVFPLQVEDSAYGTMGYHSFIARLVQVDTALQPSHAKIVWLGNIPHLASDAQLTTCPLVHASDLAGCEVTPQSQASINYRAAAVETKTTFVSPLPLFCTSSICPLWVPIAGTNYLPYYDHAHMNSTYATLLGPALTQLLAPYLSVTAPIPSAQLPQPPLTLRTAVSTSRVAHRVRAVVSGGLVGVTTLSVHGSGCQMVNNAAVVASKATVCRLSATRTTGAPYSPVVSNTVAVRFTL